MRKFMRPVYSKVYKPVYKNLTFKYIFKIKIWVYYYENTRFFDYQTEIKNSYVKMHIWIKCQV